MVRLHSGIEIRAKHRVNTIAILLFGYWRDLVFYPTKRTSATDPYQFFDILLQACPAHKENELLFEILWGWIESLDETKDAKQVFSVVDLEKDHND
jgi:hypothetical protein